MLKNKKIVLIVLISSIIFGVFFFVPHIIYEEKSPPLSSSTYIGGGGQVGVQLPTKTALQINDISFKNEIVGEISVYDFMNKLRSEKKINFTEKNYTGMGKFIVSINGIKGNGNQNWIYHVNGVEAQVGVSSYKIKHGDIVSWKYE